MDQADENLGRFRRLKWTAALGDVAVFSWYGFLGGYMSLRDGDSFGWIAVGAGIAILVLPFTGFFRTYLNKLALQKNFPTLVFLPNILLIVMFGLFASIYFQDPLLTYNDSETLAAAVFGGATVVATLALIANSVAFIKDLRA
jgi:uncharacterized membrane protein